jgi:hypothetical protein
MNPTNLNNIESREIIPGYRARFVQSENMTAAYWEIDAGSPLTDCRIIDMFYPRREEYR